MRKILLGLLFFGGVVIGVWWYVRSSYLTSFSFYCKEGNIKETESVVERLNNELISKLRSGDSAVIFVAEDDLNKLLHNLHVSGITPYRGCAKLQEDALYLFWFNRFLWGIFKIKFKETKPYFYVSSVSVYGIPLPACCREKINKQILTEYKDYFERAEITSFKITNIELVSGKVKIYVERKE